MSIVSRTVPSQAVTCRRSWLSGAGNVTSSEPGPRPGDPHRLRHRRSPLRRLPPRRGSRSAGRRCTRRTGTIPCPDRRPPRRIRRRRVVGPLRCGRAFRPTEAIARDDAAVHLGRAGGGGHLAIVLAAVLDQYDTDYAGQITNAAATSQRAVWLPRCGAGGRLVGVHRSLGVDQPGAVGVLRRLTKTLFEVTAIGELLSQSASARDVMDRTVAGRTPTISAISSSRRSAQ